jgi:hypothetical protein
MTSPPPRRPILHLKDGAQATANAAAPFPSWKCKPCGATLDVDVELADGDVVRRPACKARIGKAGDLRSAGAGSAKIRAPEGLRTPPDLLAFRAVGPPPIWPAS